MPKPLQMHCSSQGASVPATSRLLVSVRTPAEATAALAGGAGVIDVKEPLHGPLGAADIKVVQAVAAAVAGRRLVTAAAGELRDLQQIDVYHDLGVSMVKVGLAGLAEGNSWRGQLRCLAESLANSIDTTPVAYADFQRAQAPCPTEVFEAAKRIGLNWVMVDTYDKTGAGLFDCLSTGEVAKLTKTAHQAGLSVALAGRLAAAGVAQAIALGADLVGVRGAVCGGDRAGCVDAELVRPLATLASCSATVSSSVAGK